MGNLKTESQYEVNRRRKGETERTFVNRSMKEISTHMRSQLKDNNRTYVRVNPDAFRKVKLNTGRPGTYGKSVRRRLREERRTLFDVLRGKNRVRSRNIEDRRYVDRTTPEGLRRLYAEEDRREAKREARRQQRTPAQIAASRRNIIKAQQARRSGR